MKCKSSINSIQSCSLLYYTSQNTMYCGGKAEHKHIANKYTCAKKYMHITMASYIAIKTCSKINAHVMNLQA